jgi:hypothetical protein
LPAAATTIHVARLLPTTTTAIHIACLLPTTTATIHDACLLPATELALVLAGIGSPCSHGITSGGAAILFRSSPV